MASLSANQNESEIQDFIAAISDLRVIRPSELSGWGRSRTCKLSGSKSFQYKVSGTTLRERRYTYEWRSGSDQLQYRDRRPRPQANLRVPIAMPAT